MAGRIASCNDVITADLYIMQESLEQVQQHDMVQWIMSNLIFVHLTKVSFASHHIRLCCANIFSLE